MVFTVLPQRKSVCYGGKKWENVLADFPVRGLSPSSSKTDILTKTSFLTKIFINNSPLSYCQDKLST